MLGDVVQNFETFLRTEVEMYYVAATGICAFLALYYIGDYLFRDRDAELDFSSEETAHIDERYTG